MLKFVGSHDGKSLVGFGLSAENISRLQNGQPVLINMNDLGNPQVDFVLIFTGTTEEEMRDELLAAGVMGKTSRVHYQDDLPEDISKLLSDADSYLSLLFHRYTSIQDQGLKIEINDVLARLRDVTSPR